MKKLFVIVGINIEDVVSYVSKFDNTNNDVVLSTSKGDAEVMSESTAGYVSNSLMRKYKKFFAVEPYEQEQSKFALYNENGERLWQYPVFDTINDAEMYALSRDKVLACSVQSTKVW